MEVSDLLTMVNDKVLNLSLKDPSLMARDVPADREYRREKSSEGSAYSLMPGALCWLVGLVCNVERERVSSREESLFCC
jgi:hypothetical protein